MPRTTRPKTKGHANPRSNSESRINLHKERALEVRENCLRTHPHDANGKCTRVYAS